MKFARHASAEMLADACTSWLEAATLGWLKGYDKVILAGPAQAGASSAVIGRSAACGP